MSDKLNICIVRTVKVCDSYGDCENIPVENTPWTEVSYQDYDLIFKGLSKLNTSQFNHKLIILPPNQKELIQLSIENAKKEIEKQNKEAEKIKREYAEKNKKKIENREKKKKLKALLEKAMAQDIKKLEEIVGKVS